MKRLILMSVAVLASLVSEAQIVDPKNEYLVWTNNLKAQIEQAQAQAADSAATGETAQTFESKYFKYFSMCEWPIGMRFMVIPDKKDLVIKTFAKASTGQLMSTMSLRYKIMEYRGHSGEGQLHERVNFFCIDDSTEYYYELPSATFEDHCYTKFGVPALAYLDEVDIARRELIGKTLTTKADDYNQDTNTSGYGYEDVIVPKGTEVKVVAVGVGTRSFPCKIIVEDKNGRQFFQNIAFSRTNSGMRDEEFEEDNRKHNFRESFNLEDDNLVADGKYKKYIGKTVYTNYATKMADSTGTEQSVKRLSKFTIKKMRAKEGTNYVKATLIDKNGKTWTKDVTFVQEDVAGDIDGRHEDYFPRLFIMSDLSKAGGVRQENMDAISRHIVRPGFTEAEVLLALGDPDGHGASGQGSVYSWTYKSVLHVRQCTVFFWKKTKRVKSVR